MKAKRIEIIKTLFGRAKELGIDAETLRDDIAPAVIGKRISEANNYELGKVIDYITQRAGRKPTPAPLPGGESTPSGFACHPSRGEYKKYPSSRKGLLDEVRDLAIERYGQEEYAERLNNLCARFGEKDGYHKMRVAGLKRLKERIKELNRSDPWEKQGTTDFTDCTDKENKNNGKL